MAKLRENMLRIIDVGWSEGSMAGQINNHHSAPTVWVLKNQLGNWFFGIPKYLHSFSKFCETVKEELHLQTVTIFNI